MLPHTGLLKLSGKEMQKSAAVSGGFVVANWAMGRKEFGVGDLLAKLVGGGMAVRTLAWDALLSALVYGVLSWGGGV